MCGAHLDGASHPRGSCVHPRLGRVVGGFHQPPKLGRGQGSAVTPQGASQALGPVRWFPFVPDTHLSF